MLDRAIWGRGTQWEGVCWQASAVGRVGCGGRMRWGVPCGKGGMGAKRKREAMHNHHMLQKGRDRARSRAGRRGTAAVPGQRVQAAPQRCSGGAPVLAGAGPIRSHKPGKTLGAAGGAAGTAAAQAAHVKCLSPGRLQAMVTVTVGIAGTGGPAGQPLPAANTAAAAAADGAARRPNRAGGRGPQRRLPLRRLSTGRNCSFSLRVPVSSGMTCEGREGTEQRGR